MATDTASGPNVISVFNGATCNATDARGCGQSTGLAVLPVGKSGGAGILLAVNDATNTVYATNNPYADPTGDAVYVFNAAKCDAQNKSGCRQKPSTVTVGDDPAGLAVDRRTDTIYAVGHAEGDYAASVAVINGATCNATKTSGCRQTPASSFADFGALYIAIDPATQHVYTSNLGDTSVSVINGTSCNATNTSGCRQTPREDAVGQISGVHRRRPGDEHRLRFKHRRRRHPHRALARQLTRTATNSRSSRPVGGRSRKHPIVQP